MAINRFKYNDPNVPLSLTGALQDVVGNIGVANSVLTSTGTAIRWAAPLQGAVGSQGTQGIQGLQGIQGIQGLQGPQSTQGTQATQGVQGVQGLQGLQGPAGPIGSTFTINNLSVLLSSNEIESSGAVDTTAIKSYTVAANTFSFIMVEAEVGIIANTAISEWSFSLVYGGVTKETIPLKIADTGTGDEFKLRATLKYAEAFTAGGTVQINVAAVGTAAGTWNVHSFRVYGIGNYTFGAGPQGTQGIQGIQGVQAAQGTQGTQGLQGRIGSQGTQGIQNSQGTQGTQATQGLQGQIGSQGLQGTQASQGLQGTQSTQGVQGLQGLSVQGLQGSQGTQGVQGLQGSQGRQGIQGLQGIRGDQGTQGTQGSQGIQGIQGLQGLSVQGSIGTQGVPGVQNTQGTQATQGSQGLIGQGIQGVQSAQGLQGPQATQGLQGPQATQGIQATQGTQATQGIQGVQGPFGPPTIPAGSTASIVADDNGKLVVITAGITLNNVFTTVGQNVVIYNDTASQQTITQGTNVILRLGGTTSTGNRFIQQRGLATVVMVKTGASNEYVISGAGVT